jgi:hypothetical protein
MWSVVILPEAKDELDSLPDREQSAMVGAFAKLEVLGDRLGTPHSSNIEGSAGYLRELRPRAGSSAWRALYRRIGNEMVVGAISPEAKVDRRKFNRAVGSAIQRLDAYARDSEEIHD